MGAQLAMSPLNSFMVLDDLLVAESYSYEDRGAGELTDTHARIFDMLMTESATGEDARSLIAKAAANLMRELGPADRDARRLLCPLRDD